MFPLLFCSVNSLLTFSFIFVRRLFSNNQHTNSKKREQQKQKRQHYRLVAVAVAVAVAPVLFFCAVSALIIGMLALNKNQTEG